jgi:hypothetical protein
MVEEIGLETMTELLRQGDGGRSLGKIYGHLFGM